MLNKTTSLLPGVLFASLGMPRADESIKDARQVKFSLRPLRREIHILLPSQSIDHDLKTVCEDIILQCSEPLCEPLRSWLDRVREQGSAHRGAEGDQIPITVPDWAQQSAAVDLERNFRGACEQNLRISVTRMHLYLEDDRTVGVLVHHIQEIILGGYSEFRDVIWNMYDGAMRETVLSSTGLRDMLREICDENAR